MHLYHKLAKLSYALNSSSCKYTHTQTVTYQNPKNEKSNNLFLYPKDFLYFQQHIQNQRKRKGMCDFEHAWWWDMSKYII